MLVIAIYICVDWRVGVQFFDVNRRPGAVLEPTRRIAVGALIDALKGYFILDLVIPGIVTGGSKLLKAAVVVYIHRPAVVVAGPRQ